LQVQSLHSSRESLLFEPHGIEAAAKLDMNHVVLHMNIGAFPGVYGKVLRREKPDITAVYRLIGLIPEVKGDSDPSFKDKVDSSGFARLDLDPAAYGTGKPIGSAE